jgi:L-alanine-DL-glutamate epimerase-like enolase superfamily enzyme
MKVTRVETRTVTLKLDQPIGSALGQLHSFGCILVFVHCDSGIVGENLIFTLNARRTRVLQTMVEELGDLIIGRDAGHIANFWARAWKDINFLGHKGVPVVGISALDGALWDAFGKASKLPLYRILGGAADRVPAYHSGGLWLSSSVRELVEEAERFAAAGFKAMKMRLGSPDPTTDLARGETEYTRYGFRRMLELRSADVLMPDLQRVGGVSEFMRVGHMAESYDIPVSSHLFPETSLQVLGALSNTIYLEYMPWFSKLYSETIEFEDGQAIVPERPGWGFTFNQDYVAHLARA